ncbi:MAG TPA: hypothetical protein VEH04_17045 [Verrucomicrobiae bacterium]|nr:hypothetical protein [Verrucomicrobiae bacterium]
MHGLPTIHRINEQAALKARQKAGLKPANENEAIIRKATAAKPKLKAGARKVTYQGRETEV